MTDYKKGKGEGVSSERGIALIAAVLVVVILMAIGLSFAFNMRLEEKAAVNYMNSVKAGYIAQAGIDRAIAALRTYANDYAFFPPINRWEAYFSGSIGDDTYTVTIRDTAKMIYLNRDAGVGPENTTLDEMLDALPEIDPELAHNIINYRNTLPGDIFITKEQIKGTAGIDAATYNIFLEREITVHTWTNPKGRAPVNVNTASEAVLRAVLWPIVSTAATEPPASTPLTGHRRLAMEIINRRWSVGPFTTWRDFNDFIDEQTYLDPTQRDRVKRNSNPNADKSALPRITTEFSFNSGGYFEIESTGRVYFAGSLAAEKKIKAVVNIFDIWHQTTRAQFRGNTLRAVDATTRFYRVGYAGAVQLAHLLVETEEINPPPPAPQPYPGFNFTSTGHWGSLTSGGFNANPFKTPSDDYRRRNDNHAVQHTATCRWNFAITDAQKLTGGTYDVFAWWLSSVTNSSSVTYERRIGDGPVTLLATRNQQGGGGAWNRLGSLFFPVGTTAPSFIGIQALGAAVPSPPTRRSIADAMMLAAVNAAGELYAGTMTASFSPTLSPGENIQLGTIAWTEAFVGPNTDITFDVGVAPLPSPPSGQRGTHTNPAGNPLSGSGTTIFYRAYFSRTAGLTTPADPPILEDVTITYLPRTRILYWREVTE